MAQSCEYKRLIYGEQLDWYDTRAKFRPTKNYYPEDDTRGMFVQTEEQAVQSDNKPVVIDKHSLPFDKKMALYLKEFCFSTSAHGLPMIGQAPGMWQKIIWAILFVTSFTIYWVQIVKVMDKYNLMEKNVNIKLIFEAPPIPAITMCNLNPYRRSEVAKVPLVAKTMKAFEDVMSSVANPITTQAPAPDYGNGRHRRSSGVPYELAFSLCSGDPMFLGAHKTRYPKDKEEDDQMCLCAFDRHAGDAFPCYTEDKWKPVETCPVCEEDGMCYPEGRDLPKDDDTGLEVQGVPHDCRCQTVNTQFACIAAKKGAPLLELWIYFGDPIATEDPGFLEALGFSGMTDEVAIVTQAKENIIFVMATLSMQERSRMSHIKDEFVQKCSFNGAQCNIEEDFKTHIDPNFGNCFTFNHNLSQEFTSARAGPMYGLRMIVFVNVSEYLPTTEAAGVKMTFHEKREFPFPDIFGYNAPVGYISSFGIKLKRMLRLPSPYGECVSGPPPPAYIYEDNVYSTEGCLRTCFQLMVVRECDCGDPRFPVPSQFRHCSATNPVERRCLTKQSSSQGGSENEYKCACKQPCESTQYTVTYSASQWPSPSLQMQLGLCDGPQEECVQYYRDNAAMIEVFYDQLNYEFMEETPAYGFVNLLADFGGQLGLWLGVSVITCCEFVYLVLQVGSMVGRHHYQIYLKNKLIKEGKLPADKAT